MSKLTTVTNIVRNAEKQAYEIFSRLSNAADNFKVFAGAAEAYDEILTIGRVDPLAASVVLAGKIESQSMGRSQHHNSSPVASITEVKRENEYQVVVDYKTAGRRDFPILSLSFDKANVKNSARIDINSIVTLAEIDTLNAAISMAQSAIDAAIEEYTNAS